jgi:Fe-Mn family superoxide dismutase
MNGLEPVISQELMEYHYGKHHVTYITNYNNLQLEAADALSSGNAQKLIELTQAIKFNGGGHLNHEFFWESLCPVKDAKPIDQSSELFKKIESAFGSWDSFIVEFSSKTGAVQGSGWGWLAYNKNSKAIEFRTTFN